MRLGGPIFVKSDDPEELAKAHRSLGYRAAYTPGGMKLADTARLKAVREAYAKHDVVIAETGVWNNLMEPDEAKRKGNLQAVIEGMALAEEIGARCCVNIAGGYNTGFWAGPHSKNFSKDAFDLAVENARKVIDAVKPKAAKFSYEMMPHMMPDSAERYVELIKAVDRPAFAVHLDVVNAINSPYRCYDTTAVIAECIEKLGPYAVSCHLKDIAMADEVTVVLKEVPLGEGVFDVGAYMKGVAGLPQEPPLMLEHLPNEAAYDKARAYAVKLAKGMGIAL
ncbi:MAG: sugar phosphate isomerase/epimerase family protein [Armatimonadota bacterium]